MHSEFRTLLLATSLLLPLAACSPDISPDTYNSAAVQQANKVDQGVIIGVRQVSVKVSGNTGAVAGAAAGGILGGQVPGSSTGQALGTVGGGLLGGLLGSSVEQAAGDTKAWEYIVRKSKSGELVSVTQTGEPPLVVGQGVLVIAGSQARIVPDYTVKLPDEMAEKPTKQAAKPQAVADDKPADAPVVAKPNSTELPAAVLSTTPVAGSALPNLMFPASTPASPPADSTTAIPVVTPPAKTRDEQVIKALEGTLQP